MQSLLEKVFMHSFSTYKRFDNVYSDNSYMPGTSNRLVISGGNIFVMYQ